MEKTRKNWEYVNISREQLERIDALIDMALKDHGIHQSRADIIAEAVADYIAKPEIQQKLHSVPRKHRR
jgi:predicted nucleic-acid-binding protein